ncbi:MAG: hypothetical protein WKG07_07310 [Hymenobacter sp.]
MKQALEEATQKDVTVPHPHADPHGIRDVLRQLGVAEYQPRFQHRARVGRGRQCDPRHRIAGRWAAHRGGGRGHGSRLR